MIRIHRLLAAFWLALALVAGQHAAALHMLGHVFEQAPHQKDSKPAPLACDECPLLSSLSGAAAATVPEIPRLEGHAVHAGSRIAGIARAPRVPFHSRAPPLPA